MSNFRIVALRSHQFCTLLRSHGLTIGELLHEAKYAKNSWICRDVDTRELIVAPAAELRPSAGTLRRSDGSR